MWERSHTDSVPHTEHLEAGGWNGGCCRVETVGRINSNSISFLGPDWSGEESVSVWELGAEEKSSVPSGWGGPGVVGIIDFQKTNHCSKSILDFVHFTDNQSRLHTVSSYIKIVTSLEPQRIFRKTAHKAVGTEGRNFP